MKTSIYNGVENLSKKQVNTERAKEKNNVRETLKNFELSLNSAFKQLTATGSTARNAANACKGTYKTALEVVAACYPYQTENGQLCTKTKDGYKLRKLSGTATAYAIVKTAVCNFIDYKTKRVEKLINIVEPIEA